MESNKEFDDKKYPRSSNHGKEEALGLQGGDSREKVIPVIEESVKVGKKWVEKGNFQITKKVIEHDESIDLPLFNEDVNIERVEVNQYVESLPPPVRYEGETIVIPVLREVVVKRVMLVEELRVTRKKVQSQEKHQVTLLKEEVNVEHQPSKPANS